MTHTPWTLFRFSRKHHWKVDTGNPDWFVDCGFDEEVARKVAATQELLEACQAFNSYLEAPFPANLHWKLRASELVDEAIAKATGGE